MADNTEILRRRTFAIIAHPDAGKTSLTEKLLLFGGQIQVAGAGIKASIRGIDMLLEEGMNIIIRNLKISKADPDAIAFRNRLSHTTQLSSTR